MMLSINGESYNVIATGAAEGKPERSGGPHVTWNGKRRSTVKYERRNWGFTLIMTNAEYTTLYASTRLAVQVPCAGDALPYPVTCEVEIDSAEYVKSKAQSVDFERVVTVHLFQVTPV